MPDEMLMPPPDEQAQAAPPMAPPMQGPVAPPPPGGLGNQDISQGPVMSALPTLYSPNQNAGRTPTSFNSSAFAAEAFQKLPPDVALKAMEGARQLEGTLGFDADVKAGVPTPVALSKWAPLMWYRHPPSAIAAINANKPAFQPEEITLTSGQKVTRMSPQRVAFSPTEKRTDLTPGEQIHSITAQMKGLEAGIKAEADPKKEAAMWQEHAALGQQLGELRSKGHKAPDTIKVKEKATGKVFRYPAHRKSEVPDAYEVVSD